MWIEFSLFCEKYNLNRNKAQITLVKNNDLVARLDNQNNIWNENDLNKLFSIEKPIPTNINLFTEKDFQKFFNNDLKQLYSLFKKYNAVDDSFKEVFIRKLQWMLIHDIFWMLKYPLTDRTKKLLKFDYII